MLLDKKSLKRIQWEILVEYVYISNKIEGASLSLEETREILETSHDILARPTYYQHLSINHANAFEFIRQNVKNDITNQMVKELHTVVMKNIDKEAGKYRNKNNINNRLESFLRKLNSTQDYHPLEKSALIQGFFHQSTLTRSGHPGYTGKGGQRHGNVNIFEISCPGPTE
jgi:Fic family protein